MSLIINRRTDVNRETFWSLIHHPGAVRLGRTHCKLGDELFYCEDPPDGSFESERQRITMEPIHHDGDDEEPWEIDWRKVFVKTMPWLLSVNTIYSTVLAGNVDARAWAWGLAGQAGWLAWIWASRNWGLLPMNFALWYVYWRNYLLWLH